jgi:transcriptional regulator with XRE-family HTH domain
MGYAEKLQRLCVQKGLDQSALAEAVGLSRSSISRILSGGQEPKLGVAWKLARRLGVPLDYLADEEDAGEPGGSGAFVHVSEDELTILKLVRRLGVEESMDRLLAVKPAAEAPENGARTGP